MNTIKNDVAERITEVKQIARGFSEAINALTTPLPAKSQVISYQDITIDQTTGRYWYKGKEHRPRKSSLGYIILDQLVSKMGRPVSYGELLRAIKLVRGQETRINNEMISTAVRDLRRTLGIVVKQNPQDDIFLATGDGYRIIPK